jgi:hypothetical protein
MDSSCGSKSKWALVHLCTCKAAANRSIVYVSGKNNKILPIPETNARYINQRRVKRKKGAKKKKKKKKRNLILPNLTHFQEVIS